MINGGKLATVAANGNDNDYHLFTVTIQFVTLSAIATDGQWLSSKAKTYENQTDTG